MIKKLQNSFQKLNKKRILIIGGSSFFSLSFIKEHISKYEIVGTYFKNKKKIRLFKNIKVDIRNKKNIEKSISAFKPHIIINAAGLTNVEDCENNYSNAYNVNSLGTKYIAEICEKLKIKLVHISTDHIFDGKKNFYTETEKLNPLNNYAKSKAIAELYVRKINPTAIVIRTNFFGLGYGHSKKFFDKIIENLSLGRKIRLFADIFYTPISLYRLVNIINLLIKEKAKGVYNVVGNERISKYHFGLKIAEIFGYQKNLIVKDYFLKRKKLTKRPLDMSLSIFKIEKKLKIKVGDATDSIFDYLNLKNKKIKKTLPYGKQYIFKKDLTKVIKILKSNYITQGPEISLFEKKIAKYVGAKYAVAVSSCSAGLHLACKVLDLKKGFDLITSPITFVSSANASLHNGAKVILNDIEPNNALISTDELEKNLKKFKSIKAIMPIHFSGAACNMKKIHSLARKYNKHVIEDAAHALGARYSDNSMVGNCKFSDFCVFSFHPVKTITAGEGGIITTNDFDLYSKILLLRNHGINKNENEFINKTSSTENFKSLPWYYEMLKPGFHYRMTDIQAGLASSQMDNISKILNERKYLAKRYDKKFKNFKNLKLLQKKFRNLSANHLYVLRINFKKLKRTKKNFFEYLKYHGVSTQVHYVPLYMQPYFSNEYDKSKFKNSEKYYKEAVSIPLYYGLSKKEQNLVVKLIYNFLYRLN